MGNLVNATCTTISGPRIAPLRSLRLQTSNPHPFFLPDVSSRNFRAKIPRVSTVRNQPRQSSIWMCANLMRLLPRFAVHLNIHPGRCSPAQSCREAPAFEFWTPRVFHLRRPLPSDVVLVPFHSPIWRHKPRLRMSARIEILNTEREAFFSSSLCLGGRMAAPFNESCSDL